MHVTNYFSTPSVMSSQDRAWLWSSPGVARLWLLMIEVHLPRFSLPLQIALGLQVTFAITSHDCVLNGSHRPSCALKCKLLSERCSDGQSPLATSSILGSRPDYCCSLTAVGLFMCFAFIDYSIGLCFAIFTGRGCQKSKSKLSYERRSVDQSILVLGHHLGPATNSSFSSTGIFFIYLRCEYEAPSLAKGPVCNYSYKCY
jgi:hypothetical protein